MNYNCPSRLTAVSKRTQPVLRSVRLPASISMEVTQDAKFLQELQPAKTAAFIELHARQAKHAQLGMYW